MPAEAFAQEHATVAAARGHLTMADAGRLAGATGAGRVEPFHFSARYARQEARLLREVDEAFHAGEVRCADPPPLGSSGRTG